MKRINAIVAAAAALGGTAYLATHAPEGCTTAQEGAAGEQEASSSTPAVAAACDSAHSATLHAAGDLLVKVAPEHSTVLSSAYQCVPQDTQYSGQDLVAAVTTDANGTHKQELYPTFFDPWRTPAQRAAALATLDSCAQAGESCFYTGPGARFYPGGHLGQEAERIFKEATTRARAEEGGVGSTVLNSESVHNFTGKGTYSLTDGKFLSGFFKEGEISDGKYTVGNTVLQGRFSIGDKGEVIPKEKITLRFSDGGELTCSFANGSPDGTQAASYRTPSGDTVELITFKNATSSSPAWYGNFRPFQKETPDYYYYFDRYTINEAFTLHIEQNVKGP